EAVQAPEARERLRHRPLAVVGVAHVARDRDERPAAERARRLLEPLRALVEDGDARPGRDPGGRRRAPDPRRAAAHQRDPAREAPGDVRHGAPSTPVPLALATGGRRPYSASPW